MNKKILLALTAITLTITTLPASKAEEAKPATLAIIDTALNNTIPQIKNNIVYEVCILDWKSCQNKTQFQEGIGAASMPSDQILKNGFAHGTQMVSAAVTTNPNIKIVFIRFVGATADGSRQITNESSFVNAMTWIYYNKDRFNIKAVAMSQSHHNLGFGTNYCPNTPLTADIINKLNSAQIPVFLPAGNTRDLKRIDWPSCIPTAFSVSASAYGDGQAVYTNYDVNLTDIFARGDMKVLSPDGKIANTVGTSIATQVAAASYIALANRYPAYTSSQLLDLLKSKTIPLASRAIKNARIVDPLAALNG